jgi:hypothetical protein
MVEAVGALDNILERIQAPHSNKSALRHLIIVEASSIVSQLPKADD